MNNNLMIIESSNVLTMSSLEIAELTGKDHRNVMRDIRNMLNLLDIQSAQFGADYKDSKGRTYSCYNLPKDLADLLLTEYKGLSRVHHRIREESSLKTATVWHVISLFYGCKPN